MLTNRPATTLDDLQRAGALTSRAWQSGSATCVATPAGIEWWHASTYPDQLEDHLRLWLDADALVAWSWHDSGEIEWHAWTGDAERDVRVLRAILETAIEEAAGGRIGTWTAEDDTQTLDVLGALGFTAAGRRLSQWQRLARTGLPGTSPLADGYRIRSLRGPDDFPGRVDVHRAAFDPSRLTVEKYQRLATLPHYRLEDDLVVEAPDGSFVAFALAWWDPDGRVGEFEPVGTHPDHRRRGFSKALLTFGMRRHLERGAQVVLVYSDADMPASEALYESAGFERRAFHQRYERPAATAPATVTATATATATATDVRSDA